MSIQNTIKSGLVGIVLATGALTSSCSKNEQVDINYNSGAQRQTASTANSPTQYAQSSQVLTPVKPVVEFNTDGIYVNSAPALTGKSKPTRDQDEKISYALRSLATLVKNSSSSETSVDVFNKDKKPTENYSFIATNGESRVIASPSNLQLYEGNNLLLEIKSPASSLVAGTYNLLWKQYTNTLISNTAKALNYDYSPIAPSRK